jgi:hypothetical protein
MARFGSLGTLSGNILGTPMGALNGEYGPVAQPLPQVPAACWDKPNFKACQSWAIASPHADCQKRAAAGDWNATQLDNCIQDKYRYRMNVNCIGSCAAGTVQWPGFTPGAVINVPAALTTLELQKAVNALLKPAGYVALVEDGVIGPKTCGAAKQFMADKVPVTCTSFTAPVKVGAYVAPKTGGSTAVVVTPKTGGSSTTTVTTASLLSSTKWVIGSSIAIALGLVGMAVAQKKGWIKGHGTAERKAK